MASILLVGKPHSTKTTFITQLIARIESGKSVISLYKPIEDLTSIIDASKAIAKPYTYLTSSL
jgi:stage III sporulation protein SpoIIIAA